jgi:hypothetical protein
MWAMPAIPESTRASVAQRLRSRASTRWPRLAEVTVRYRAGFAYIDGHLHDGEVVPLCRLRYGGIAQSWGFALYLASSDRYEDQILPTGDFAGTPEDALDCAAGLYLSYPDI